TQAGRRLAGLAAAHCAAAIVLPAPGGPVIRVTRRLTAASMRAPTRLRGSTGMPGHGMRSLSSSSPASGCPADKASPLTVVVIAPPNAYKRRREGARAADYPAPRRITRRGEIAAQSPVIDLPPRAAHQSSDPLRPFWEATSLAAPADGITHRG